MFAGSETYGKKDPSEAELLDTGACSQGSSQNKELPHAGALQELSKYGAPACGSSQNMVQKAAPETALRAPKAAPDLLPRDQLLNGKTPKSCSRPAPGPAFWLTAAYKLGRFQTYTEVSKAEEYVFGEGANHGDHPQNRVSLRQFYPMDSQVLSVSLHFFLTLDQRRKRRNPKDAKSRRQKNNVFF